MRWHSPDALSVNLKEDFACGPPRHPSVTKVGTDCPRMSWGNGGIVVQTSLKVDPLHLNWLRVNIAESSLQLGVAFGH